MTKPSDLINGNICSPVEAQIGDILDQVTEDLEQVKNLLKKHEIGGIMGLPIFIEREWEKSDNYKPSKHENNNSYQIKLCTDLIPLALFCRKNIYKFSEVRKHLEFFFDDDIINSAMILLKIGKDET